MRRVLDLLFDLGSIPEGASGLELTWARPIPGWGWSIVILLSITLAAWSYSRLKGPRWGRGALALVRASIILLVIVVIAGPQIRHPREEVEQDVVLVLVDRSASMAIRDVVRDGGRISREEQLSELLGDGRETWRALTERSELRWLGFASGAYRIPGPEDGSTGRGEADGWRTDLSSALQQALDGIASRPLSGVVVLSDGRTSGFPDRSILRRLQQDAIPVISIPLGSAEPIRDVSIREVEAPRRAFSSDSIPVIVDIDSSGLEPEELVVVRLLDGSDDTVLDRRSLSVSEASESVLLTATLEEPGDRNLVVEVRSGDGDGDLISENDFGSVDVTVVDRPIRVLYIEGYPRWEYRYLKNIMVREGSIESSVMLVSADRDFAQEGNAPITRLPRTAEEFAAFDLIVMGDIPSGFFSPEQLKLIENQVSERGAGLFWIGGDRHLPSDWEDSGLENLLPLRPPLDLDDLDGPVQVRPTDLSRRLGVLVLDPDAPDGWAEELTDSETGWSGLRSVQSIPPEQVKPTAEPLAVGNDASGEVRPLLLSMRFGAGQVLYAAMDDIWRWRFGRGELYTERWWIGLIRMLARQSLDQSGRVMELMVDPDELVPGSVARIQLDVLDERTAETLGDRIAVEITDRDERSSTELELLRSGDTAEWSANWFPDRVGTHLVKVVDPQLVVESEDLGTIAVDVIRPDDEFRNPDADHDLLVELAESTGGTVLDRDSLDSLPSHLPNREILVENPIIVPIWNSGLVFFLLIGLLTLEWIGRRLLRMI